VNENFSSLIENDKNIQALFENYLYKYFDLVGQKYTR